MSQFPAGTLICGENANPLARFALIAQGEEVHIFNYPSMPGADYGGYNIGADIQLRGAAHAFEGKVFHVVVSSLIDGAVVDKLADTEEKQRILTSPQSGLTGIFAPGGKLMSDKVSPDREEIVCAVCDIEAIIGPKLRHDVAGQNNRFDVLSLNLNRAPCRPITEVGKSTLPEESPTDDDPES